MISRARPKTVSDNVSRLVSDCDQLRQDVRSLAQAVVTESRDSVSDVSRQVRDGIESTVDYASDQLRRRPVQAILAGIVIAVVASVLAAWLIRANR